MSGRKPIKIHQYTFEGKKLKVWKNMSELKSHYFNNTQYPIFENSKEYDIVDNTILFKVAVGRETVKRVVKILNSEFVPKRKLNNTFNIGCYNLNGDLLATFTSDFALSALLGKKHSLAANYSKAKKLSYFSGNKTDLIFIKE
jgi:hypothetical protein